MKANLISIRAVWFTAALIAPLMTLTLIGDAAAGKIYRCVDDNKKVTMSDTPCAAKPAAGGDAEKKDDKAGPAAPPKKGPKG